MLKLIAFDLDISSCSAKHPAGHRRRGYSRTIRNVFALKYHKSI